MSNQYYIPKQWAERLFEEESRPHPETIRRWIKSGALPSKKIGNRAYIEWDFERSGEKGGISSTGNTTADEIIARISLKL